MKLRKLMATMMVAVLATGLLAGCGNKASETAEAPEAGVESEAGVEAPAVEGESAGAKDVTVWYYWEGEMQQAGLDQIIQDYNSSQSTYQITAKYVPFADFKKQLSIGASADELPDLAILDSPDHASYANMGIFEDITDKFDVSNYFEGAVESCKLDGVLYGVPFGVNCLSLYYNADMLEAAGITPPTTWDELQVAATALTKDNVTGLAFCSVQNEEGTFNFMPWVWSTGASSFELNSSGGVKALGFVGGLIESGAMSKECMNWTQGDVMSQFSAGNIAMMVNGPWQIPPMQENAPDLNWKVTLIPKDQEFASVLGGENYAVVKGGNTEGALDFLKYATEKEQVEKIMEKFGYISADQNIATTQFAEDSPYQAFVEQLKYAKPRGPHAEWPSISDAISLAFNEVMTGTATPEEAGEKAQATIDGIIK